MQRLIGFLLCVLLLAGCGPTPTSGAAPTPQVIRTPTLLVAPARLATGTLAPPVTPAPQATSTPTPLLAPAQTTPLAVLDDSLAELRQITQMRRSGLLNNAGWLHRVLRQNGQVNNFLLASVAVPGQVDREEWWLLDSSGGVKAALRRTLAADGTTSRTSILKNGVWQSLDNQADSSTLPVSTYLADLGYLALAERLVKSNQALNTSVLYQNCWNLGVHFNLLDGKTLHEALFNPDNGKLRWLKDWDISTGSAVLRDSQEVLVEEPAAAPPADVLAALGE